MRCFKLMCSLAIIVPSVKPDKGDDEMCMIQDDVYICIVYRRRACHLRQDRVGDSPIDVNVVRMIAVYYSPIGLSSADISITGLSNEIVILQILDSSVTIYFCGSSRNEKKG